MSTANFDIATTIEQARTGDTGAFAQIVRQYQSLVSGVLFSATGDFHKSEDFTQETFLIAWQKLGELRETDHLAAWLCTIARNLVHRSHRKPTITTEPLIDDTGGLASAAHAPDAALLRQEQSDFVWSAIGEIDEKYRETLVLYYRGGQSIREIAAAMELTEDAVGQRLVRARKSLKAKLEEMVGTILTDTAPGEAFTLTVMAALGAAILTATAEAAIAGTAIVATTGTVATGTIATGGATTGKATGLAIFWSVIGPLVYFLWVYSMIFIGQWTQLRNAPTLNARRYRLYSSSLWCKYFLPVWIGVFIIIVPFAWIIQAYGFSKMQPVILFFVFVFFMLAHIVPLMLRFRKRYRNIIETDLGIAETPAPSYSYTKVARSIDSALFVNLLIVVTLGGIALILPLTDGSSGVIPFFATIGVTLLVGLGFYGFYRFERFLLETCCKETGLQDAPPFIDKAFETALGRTPLNAASATLRSKRQPAWVNVWLHGGLVVILAVFASYLDWTTHPVWTAGCLFGFVFGIVIPAKYNKRFEKSSLLRLLLFNVFLGFIFVSCALVLLKIQFGSISPVVLWNEPDPLARIIGFGLFCGCIGAVVVPIRATYSYLWTKRPKKLQDENYDERIRLAIERYNPVDSEEEKVFETPPLPKRWVRFLCWYGAAIVVMWCVGVLIPNPYAHKKMLERNGDYTALIALEPDNAKWYYMRAIYERDGGRIEDLDMAIRLKPDYASAYNQRAQARIHPADGVVVDVSREDCLLALDDINEAIRLEPNKCSHQMQRAWVYVKMDDYDAAERDFNELIRRMPNSRYYSQRANFFDYTKKDLQAALADYTAAIQCAEQEKSKRRYSEYPLVILYRDRGELYKKLGESEKAKADFEKAETEK